MGELYNPYPKLPKNIRQIGERDQSVKLYVEDYVNTYLKRLYPAGGQDLRVGLLVGETRSEDGMPYLFADGAMEIENVTRDGERVEFTEDAWKKAYQTMEQCFPRRHVLGWFLCGAPGCTLSPLNYWKQHSQYFPARNQLMYLNCGLEGEEAIYVASEEGFYKLRGYCIYYERNQMMQDYMVSRKEAHRVESGTRDAVITDFRQKMEEKKVEARQRHSTVNALGMACGVLSVMVLAGGVVMFNNYHKMKAMESVIASVVPEGTGQKWSDMLSGGRRQGKDDDSWGDELEIEEVPGEVYPTQAQIVIETDPAAPASAGGEGNAQTGAGQNSAGAAAQPGTGAGQSSAGAAAQPGAGAGQSSAGAAAQPGAGAGQSSAGAAAQPGTGAGQSSSGTNGTNGAEVPQAEPVQVPSDAVLYTVQAGETLYGICMERYHNLRSMQEICRWNQLDDENRISVGQELYVPPVDPGE